jgi:hypothetical protein
MLFPNLDSKKNEMVPAFPFVATFILVGVKCC